jgi:hypothetical protein
VVSYNQPKLCPNPSWNQNATTFANVSTIGSYVQDIFIDKNNTVYVAAYSLNQIVIFLEGNATSTRVISGNFSNPNCLFVTPNNDLYVAYSLTSGYYINKWTLFNGTNDVFSMTINSFCRSLFIDINYNIYCSMTNFALVIKYSFNDSANEGTVVAGNGLIGPAATMLSSPVGIFVNTNFDLYVADLNNNRIQLFPPGQMDGITVAGFGSVDNFTLYTPIDVNFDGNGDMYILDVYNGGRVVKSGPNGFQCVIGCGDTQQLNNPFDMHFDSHGNIFICDTDNSRIQEFTLATDLCGKSNTFLNEKKSI